MTKDDMPHKGLVKSFSVPDPVLNTKRFGAFAVFLYCNEGPSDDAFS